MMCKVCDSWSLEDLVEMDEQDMENLLGFYKPGTVPAFRKIHGDESDAWEFDGSFGWW